MIAQSGIVQTDHPGILTVAEDGPGITGQARREKRVSETVRQTREMVAMMNPLLGADEFAFCATNDVGLAARARESSLGWFSEGEGTSLILERGVAEALGFPADLPMRRIEL